MVFPLSVMVYSGDDVTFWWLFPAPSENPRHISGQSIDPKLLEEEEEAPHDDNMIPSQAMFKSSSYARSSSVLNSVVVPHDNFQFLSGRSGK